MLKNRSRRALVTTDTEESAMRCGHCKAAVEEAAAKVAGIVNPQVSLEDKELRFEESGPVDMQALRTAISDIGFDPE